MIINIIMPTYNDEDTILETLNSIKVQTYKNWHLTIVNDGGTDNTENIIKKFIKNNNLDEKITYIYKENGDQLNAIKRGLEEIKDNNGLIYICHSDDLIDNEYVFEKAIGYFENNDVDAIIADLNIIDENSNLTGIQKVKKYENDMNSVALIGLWLGRNIYTDVAFYKYKVFKNNVYENYLTWNTPFWLNSFNELSILNVKKVDFSFMRYRVFEGNYINNEIGLLNVLNGELRCALNILKNVKIYFYKEQYILFRLFNKLHIPYKVLYSTKGETKNIGSIVKFIIEKRINMNDINKYPYFEAIIKFFENYPNDRTIELKNIKDEDIFLGSDMRKFNNLMINKKLPDLYYNLFKEMNNGFKIVKTTKKDYNNVIKILKFMDIFKYVTIIY